MITAGDVMSSAYSLKYLCNQVDFSFFSFTGSLVFTFRVDIFNLFSLEDDVISTNYSKILSSYVR